MLIQFDVSHAASFLPPDWLSGCTAALEQARVMLEEGNGPGGDYTEIGRAHV